MSAYLLVKWIHVLSSTVLFGTGLGIAFFFWRAARTNDPRVMAAVASDVVLADFVFTTSAVIVQPISGLLLVHWANFPLSSPWLKWSLIAYAMIGCCWLPVVWLQWRMRNLARTAQHTNTALPAEFHRLFRC